MSLSILLEIPQKSPQNVKIITYDSDNKELKELMYEKIYDIVIKELKDSNDKKTFNFKLFRQYLINENIVSDELSIKLRRIIYTVDDYISVRVGSTESYEGELIVYIIKNIY